MQQPPHGAAVRYQGADLSAQCSTKEFLLARKKSKPIESGYALFDVIYEDGSRTSNRRVPRTILGGLDGDEVARKVIEDQDNAIAEKAGRSRIPIKKISRSPV